MDEKCDRKWSRKWGTQESARRVAVGAIRSYMRQRGYNPEEFDGEFAFQTLDNFSKMYPETIAGKFYWFASDRQLDLFVEDWNKWRKEVVK